METRRKQIVIHLNEFIPLVISILVSEYDYEIIGKCILTLEGHLHVVSCCIILSTDYIVSGSHDWTLRIWNIKTGNCEKILVGHTDIITSCAILSIPSKIVSGSYDRTLKIWDTITGKCEITLTQEQENSEIIGITILSDGRIACFLKNTNINIWNAQTGQCENILKDYYDTYANAISSDGHTIYGSKNGLLKKWDVETRKCDPLFKKKIWILMAHLFHILVKSYA